MTIGVNARLIIEGKMDGIGWFSYQTLRLMVQQHREHRFILFFDRKPTVDICSEGNVEQVVLHPPARHPVLWYLFFEVSLRRALRRYRCDLLLSPDGFLPLQNRIPSVAVIHDLNFEHQSGNLKRSHQRYMSHFFPRFAHCATRIATVSDYSRHDIAATYHLPIEKIDVVYDGAHDAYRPLGLEEQQAVREQYTNGRRYLIFVSTILKRKNLSTLLQAYDRVREHHDVALVVVGRRVWWQDELQQAYDTMRHGGDVLFLGHTSTIELSRLLAAAEMLVYPSLFEGFGIPVLEAFHAETAVVASNTTSLPEVTGDAALLVDPTNPLMMADAIERLLTHPQLRQDLIARGRSQRQRFGWDKTAAALWKSIERCTQPQ